VLDGVICVNMMGAPEDRLALPFPTRFFTSPPPITGSKPEVNFTGRSS
jgi:hypothetical protein